MCSFSFSNEPFISIKPASQAPIERLPIEIIELILLPDLRLPDIRSVRLVSKTLCKSSSQGRFKTFCRTKSVDLRQHALQAMSRQVVPGSFACELQHLTVTGVLYITTSLEKVLRLKTIPADPTDIFGRREDALGNLTAVRPTRQDATSAQLVDAYSNLEVLRSYREDAALERSTGQDLAALIELFQHIRQHSVSKSLQSITLDVVVQRFGTCRLEPKDGGAWRPIWDMAAHTFATTLRALATADLWVDRLEVSNNVKVCSLSGFEIAEVLQEHQSIKLDHILRTIRSFSASTSKRVLPPLGFATIHDADPDDKLREISPRSRHSVVSPPTPTEIAESDAMASDPRDLIGLATLLSKMSHLEDLDLHRYYIHYDFLPAPSAPHGDMMTFARLVQSSNLNLLKKLTLRGWTLNAADLLAFLTANPKLQSLDLRNVAAHGSWKPVFAHLTHPDHHFNHINLDILFETVDSKSAYVQFPDSVVSIPSVPAPSGTAAFTLNGREAVVKGIAYQRSEQWVMGCVQHTMWRVERRLEYGPPSR
ncbi:hypothetical protein LTR27_000865 [Elasticomyces elasticus]|nr:hypothetical protein LTR27_000865 [Elasticomyces elasticus]